MKIENPKGLIATKNYAQNSAQTTKRNWTCMCRPSILSLAICIYLGGVAHTQFLCVTTMKPLLGLIGSRTSCEFTYGPIQCEHLVHYEVSAWSIPWFVSFYGIEVEVSTTSVKLETMTEHTGLF